MSSCLAHETHAEAWKLFVEYYAQAYNDSENKQCAKNCKYKHQIFSKSKTHGVLSALLFRMDTFWCTNMQGRIKSFCQSQTLDSHNKA